MTGTVDRARDFGGGLRDAAESGIEDAERFSEDVARGVGGSIEDVSQDVDRTADRTRDRVDRTVDRTRDRVDRTVDAGVDRAQDTVDDVGQAGQDVADHYRSLGSVNVRGGPDQEHRPVEDVAGEAASAPFEDAAEDVSPHVHMVGDEKGVDARAEREQTFADRAEAGWQDLQQGELPSKAEAGAMWFQTAEAAEWTFAGAGREVREASPTEGRGPSVGGDPVGSWPGMAAEMLIGGVGAGVGAVAQYPVTASADAPGASALAQDVATGDFAGVVQGVQNVQENNAPDAVDESGETPTEAAGGFGGLVARGAERQVDYAVAHPGPTALTLALPAAETGAGFVRGYRGGRGDVTVRYSEITDQSGAEGGVSRFETSPGEPTSKAVGEVRSRAGDQPEAVKQAAGADEVLYHTTGDQLPGALQVGEGASELPGLWTAPDANSVGLRSTSFGDQRSGSLFDYIRPSRPDLRTSTDRVAAFEGDRVAGMPEWAQGAGYEIRGQSGEVVARGLGRGEAKAKASHIEGAEVAPDQTTGGYQYLTEGADPGTAYVRPTGSRTAELEAVFPPGTEFASRSGGPNVNVRVGGRTVEVPYTDWSFDVGGETLPMDFFRRVEASPETKSAAGETARAPGETRATAEDISGSYTPMSEAGQPTGFTSSQYGASVYGSSQVPEMTGYNPADMSSAPTYSTSPERASDPPDHINPVDPYNGGSVFAEESATHVLDVDPTLTESVSGTSTTDTSTTSTSTTSTSEPTSTTSTTSTTDTSTTSTSPSGPTSSSPSFTPGFSPRPHPWWGSTPPSTGPSSSTTDTYYSPGEYSSYSTPYVPDESPDPRQTVRDRRRDRDKDVLPAGWVDMYDVDFENPIASGLEVLFGGVNAYNAGWRRDISGYEPGPGSAPPFHGARSYAEPVIDEAGDQTSIDETGGYTY